MDDETYVPLDPAQVPGNQFFHIINGKKPSDDQMVKKNLSFQLKYWCGKQLVKMARLVNLL